MGLKTIKWEDVFSYLWSYHMYIFTIMFYYYFLYAVFLMKFMPQLHLKILWKIFHMLWISLTFILYLVIHHDTTNSSWYVFLFGTNCNFITKYEICIKSFITYLSVKWYVSKIMHIFFVQKTFFLLFI